MSEHHFGLGRGRVSEDRAEQIDRVARRHGATFTTYRDPSDGWRYWFSGPNRGEPFNREMAKEVIAALVREGLADERGGLIFGNGDPARDEKGGRYGR